MGIPTHHARGFSYDDGNFNRIHINLANSQKRSMGGAKRVNGVLENRGGIPRDF